MTSIYLIIISEHYYIIKVFCKNIIHQFDKIFEIDFLLLS
jgi:hypothetical protein